jgi:hypothetical protein
MANKNDNLLKGNEKHTFTPEELSKGAKKSAEVRRAKRDLRQALETLLETEIKGKNGEIKSGAEAIAIAQFQKALKGDTRAFEVIRDTAGQQVVQKVAVAEVDNEVINEIENMVLNDD